MTYANALNQTIQSASPIPGAHLGDFVAWSLRSTTATPEQWEQAMHASGYATFATRKDGSLRAPRMPSDETVLLRAIEASAASQGLVIRKAGTDPATYSIHAYGKPEDDHHRLCRMWLLPSGLQVSAMHPLAKVAANAVGQHRVAPSYGTEDIRTFLCDELRRMRRLKLRDSGGFWFVAGTYSDQVQALVRLVEMLPGSGEVTPIPQFGSDGTYSFLSGAAAEDLGSRVKKLREEAEAWIADQKAVRESTLEDRMARVADLRAELALYADVLKLEAGDLEAALDGINGELLKLVA